MRWITIGSLLLVLACSRQPVAVQPEVVCPARPALPALSEADLAPLTEDAYRRLRERDRRRREYAEELAVICETLSARRPASDPPR